MIHFANGTTLPEFDHPYNTTALNERAVELAMAQRFLLTRRMAGMGNVLEVGNVLGHYNDRSDFPVPKRRVVDRFEVAPGVENIDVFDIEGTYDTIISISTIEHVGVDDGRDMPRAAGWAIYHLRSLLAPKGRFFCTFPTGWNAALDAALDLGSIASRSTSSTYMVRSGEDWVEVPSSERTAPRPYGQTQPWAEAVWIGEFAPLVTNP